MTSVPRGCLLPNIQINLEELFFLCKNNEFKPNLLSLIWEIFKNIKNNQNVFLFVNNYVTPLDSNTVYFKIKRKLKYKFW